mmetsp:Transcript_1420/g.2929  ORF Transcript_1420/g.2929 Transcript_1420/m.2929 type:complete len:242 (-) Transcript_1420:202-927(-)
MRFQHQRTQRIRRNLRLPLQQNPVPHHLAHHHSRGAFSPFHFHHLTPHLFMTTRRGEHHVRFPLNRDHQRVIRRRITRMQRNQHIHHISIITINVITLTTPYPTPFLRARTHRTRRHKLQPGRKPNPRCDLIRLLNQLCSSLHTNNLHALLVNATRSSTCCSCEIIVNSERKVSSAGADIDDIDADAVVVFVVSFRCEAWFALDCVRYNAAEDLNKAVYLLQLAGLPGCNTTALLRHPERL